MHRQAQILINNKLNSDLVLLFAFQVELFALMTIECFRQLLRLLISSNRFSLLGFS